jgi:hypothetical protein
MDDLERLERVASLFRQILDLLPEGDIPSAYEHVDGSVSISLHSAGYPLIVAAGGWLGTSGDGEGEPPTHEHAHIFLPSGAGVSACRPIAQKGGSR